MREFRRVSTGSTTGLGRWRVWNIRIAARLEIGKRATETPGGENFCNRLPAPRHQPVDGVYGVDGKRGWFSRLLEEKAGGTAAANISENGCGRDVDSVEIVLG